ncbi:antifungal protein ginkbilobin-like protein [Syzygium oleosum]|uniref:antifungal protein ginkbilobin-like protein n=1 Tax=Syzygium oleosum TaxID=219896 RepID=UPI0011D22089|nr:antifungal protein ginkbilobin-like protein [Syzygium oleosum]
MALVRRTLVILMWFSCICINVIADSDTTIVYKICNGIKVGFGSIYDAEVNDVLQDLVSRTADNGFNFYRQSTDLGQTCYGHAACNGAISHYDCFTCLQAARYDLTDGCPQNTGAQVQLKDCRMRYENYPFTE